MNELREIFKKKLLENNYTEDKKQKQEYFLKVTKNKSNEIIEKLLFLQDYGFTFKMFKAVSGEYGETEGYETYRIYMMFKSVTFAILYPVWKNPKYDLSSDFIMELGSRKFYNYKDFLNALSDKIEIK